MIHLISSTLDESKRESPQALENPFYEVLEIFWKSGIRKMVVAVNYVTLFVHYCILKDRDFQ